MASPEIPEVTPQDSELLTRRIHLLGTGSIGTLVAHSLMILPNPPPITILMHRREIYNDFKAGQRIVRLVNKITEINDEQTGYDVDIKENNGGQDFWKHIPHEAGKDRAPLNEIKGEELLPSGEIYIYTLIVTVKGPSTVQALQSIKHRVDQRTTILLMQNGMGQIDELNSKVFTDPATRPTYMLGIISHGAHMQGPFAVVHAGFGAVALGIHRDTDKYPHPSTDITIDDPNISGMERESMFPSDKDLYSNISSRYLLRTLTRSPELACAAYPSLDLFQLQLEKLVSNCVLNPLTALLDVPNGSMLDNPSLTRVQRLLIAEISLVIRGMPELEGIPNVRLRFSATRLEALFRGISEKTARNSSSMREDMRNVRYPEIDYINGYIVRRGEEQGIKCVLNYMIQHLIKAKHHYDIHSGTRVVPYGAGGVEAQEEVARNDDEPVVLEDVWRPMI